MSARLAYIVSIIFHPLLLPSGVVALLLYLSPTLIMVGNKEIRLFLLQIAFSFTFLLPLIFMLTMKVLKVIDSLHLPDRRQRRLPFVAISLMYLMTAYLYHYLSNRLQIDERFLLTFLGICISLVVLTIITFFYKISAHVLAISGVFGGMLAMALRYKEITLAIPLAVTAVCVGLVISARLSLKAHSCQEVLWACCVGFPLNFAIIFFA
jgi:hypothetical protein